MGMPAARVGDMHVCPMVTGVVPHVGGPILPPAAPTVITGKMPQARAGDMCTCVGPPDVIIPPCAFNVLVSKMPAARLGDMTAHGGVIVVGFPTVLIGTSPGGGGGGGGGGAMVGQGAAVGPGSDPAQQKKAFILAAKEGKPFCEVCNQA